MQCHLILLACGLVLAAGWGNAGDSANLVLKADQKEFLTLEPILVTVKSQSPGLSAGAGVKDGIRFDIKLLQGSLAHLGLPKL